MMEHDQQDDVLGVQSAELKTLGLPEADEALALIIDPASHRGVYNLVFFFSEEGRAPSMRTGYDSPLCQNIQFQPLRLS